MLWVGESIWHLSQLISLHCVCIPPAEQRLTSSVGWPAFFHLSSSVCGGGIVLICLPHQPFLPHSPFPILQVMLWHFGSCPVSCLFILLVYFHHDSENFLTPLETERKSLCVVEYVECLTTNTKKLLRRLLRGRRVLYFWKVVRFWGRPLINVTIRRCYFGFSFQRYQNHKESPTLALCKKWNLGAFRNQPSCSSCVCR